MVVSHGGAHRAGSWGCTFTPPEPAPLRSGPRAATWPSLSRRAAQGRATHPPPPHMFPRRSGHRRLTRDQWVPGACLVQSETQDRTHPEHNSVHSMSTQVIGLGPGTAEGVFCSEPQIAPRTGIQGSTRPVDHLSDRITCLDLCQEMLRTSSSRGQQTPEADARSGGPVEYQRGTRRRSGQGRTRQQGARTHKAPSPLRPHQRSHPEHPYQPDEARPRAYLPFSRQISTVLTTNKYRSHGRRVGGRAGEGRAGRPGPA